MKKIKQKNKRAWIRLVEAFIAILLIAGILFLIINQKYIGERDLSAQIYQEEVSILRKIEMNKTLRGEVLGASPPVFWNEDGFPSGVKTKITDEIPSNLDCLAKICEITDVCALEEDFEEEITGDIYVQSVGIFANLTHYAPGQLKIFCWVKET